MIHDDIPAGTPDMTLIADIGAGTQDILLYDPQRQLENCFKMILPAPTQIKAGEIRAVTGQGLPLSLSGRIMGGGACVAAVRAHLEAGLPVYASESAAKTISDNLERVSEMGVILDSRPPKNAIEVKLADIDEQKFRGLLKMWGIAPPARYAVAVQDHGHSPQASNRVMRMQRWRNFMDEGGRIIDLAYMEPPPTLTRMQSVADSIQADVMLMDTGSAAICGALQDPRVAAAISGGAVIVNLGNGHTLIAVVQGGLILALCEHHTLKITPAKLLTIIEKLCAATLTHQEIFDDAGHGTAMASGFKGLPSNPLVAVTGPRRALAAGLPFHQAVPHGDMMLSGCFGLLSIGNLIGFIPDH